MAGKRNRTAAIVVAAGSGRRFGGRVPKQFIPVRGKPLLVWSLRILEATQGIDALVVVAPQRYVSKVREICRRARIRKVYAVVPGGRRRRDSVLKGLLAVPVDTATVLVHDAARPLVSERLVRALLRAVRSHPAVIPALPVTDTLKRERRGIVTGTVDRNGLWAVQTPQAFHYGVLWKAHRRAGSRRGDATDDALLVERSGVAVRLIPGSVRNLKVTTRDDLAVVEMWLKNPGLG